MNTDNKEGFSKAIKKLKDITGGYWDSISCVCAELGRSKCGANCKEYEEDIGNVSTLFNSHQEVLTKIIELTEENNKLREALEGLVHLHMCEQEGIGSGQPTPAQWYAAVDKASEALINKP